MTANVQQLENLEAEQAVLGACLTDRDVILSVITKLQSRDFNRRNHQVLFAAISDLYWRQIPADIIAVTDSLERNGNLGAAGGESYLAELIAATPTTVHANYYADIVVDYAIRRRLVEAAQEIVKRGYSTSDNLDDVVADVQTTLERALTGINRDAARSMESIVDQFISGLDKPQKHGVNFGISLLDRIIGGMQAGELVIVAARPSVGKSSLAHMTAFHNTAYAGCGVTIVSLEMKAQSYIERILGMETGINTRRIGGRGMSLRPDELTRVKETAKRIQSLPLFIDDKSSPAIEDICNRVRNMAMDQEIKLVIIDHIALARSRQRSQNRNAEMGIITSQLKRLAMDLDIPVMAIHQLSRAGIHRSESTPILSDLRDSGNVEQDADIVIFLHTETPPDGRLAPVPTDLIVAKHRNGPTGRVNLIFKPDITKFEIQPATGVTGSVN